MGKVVSGQHVIVRRPHIQSHAASLLLRSYYRQLRYYQTWEKHRKAYLGQFKILICAYCHKSPLLLKSKDEKWLATIDHIVPRAKGGTDTWDNYCVACSPCNSGKKDKMPHQVREAKYTCPRIQITDNCSGLTTQSP